MHCIGNDHGPTDIAVDMFLSGKYFAQLIFIGYKFMVCSLSNACAEVPPFVAHGHMKLRVGMLSLYYLCIVLVMTTGHGNKTFGTLMKTAV